ncbi:MAG: iron-sulfur cluster assembly scaffold protein, partial [Proteobacteria bacterium]|nr:iron-sulfur cluster assembly scaffold protein [Pseudomonadota bacterium]
GVTVRGAAQGVRLQLSAAAAGGRVIELRFRAWGCPHLIAAAAAFCTGYTGQRLSHLLEFSAAGIMQTLAVPVEKTGRILVLEDAVRSLGAAVHEQSGQQA